MQLSYEWMILPSQKQIPALDAISDLDICTLCFSSSIHSHWVGFARWTLYNEKSFIDALSSVIIMTVGCIYCGGSPLFCTKIWFQRSQFLVGYDFRVWLWNTKGKPELTGLLLIWTWLRANFKEVVCEKGQYSQVPALDAISDLDLISIFARYASILAFIAIG